jgi:hypothetical protein
MADFIRAIIGLTIGIVVFASLYMSTVKTTNQSGWTAQEITLWGLLSIVGIVGIVYAVLNIFGIG